MTGFVFIKASGANPSPGWRVSAPAGVLRRPYTGALGPLFSCLSISDKRTDSTASPAESSSLCTTTLSGTSILQGEKTPDAPYARLDQQVSALLCSRFRNGKNGNQNAHAFCEFRNPLHGKRPSSREWRCCASTGPRSKAATISSPYSWKPRYPSRG